MVLAAIFSRVADAGRGYLTHEQVHWAQRASCERLSAAPCEKGEDGCKQGKRVVQALTAVVIGVGSTPGFVRDEFQYI